MNKYFVVYVVHRSYTDDEVRNTTIERAAPIIDIKEVRSIEATLAEKHHGNVTLLDWKKYERPE